MKRFLALFQVPPAVIDQCKATDAAERGPAEAKMMADVEAECLEDAARLFENHPHFGIPQTSIEVMELRRMGRADS